MMVVHVVLLSQYKYRYGTLRINFDLAHVDSYCSTYPASYVTTYTGPSHLSAYNIIKLGKGLGMRLVVAL